MTGLFKLDSHIDRAIDSGSVGTRAGVRHGSTTVKSQGMPASQPTLRNCTMTRDRREEMLDEASRLLNAHGVSQTTLNDLAALRGVTRNALYYYFSDIEDLLHQV